jgi:hypothetical protein
MLEDFGQNLPGINDPMLIDIAADKIRDLGTFGLQLVVQLIERIFRPAEIRGEVGKKHFHVPKV